MIPALSLQLESAVFVLPVSRGNLKADSDIVAGLNASVRAELESRFSQMDLSQKEIMQQLQAVKMQISTQVLSPVRHRVFCYKLCNTSAQQSVKIFCAFFSCRETDCRLCCLSRTRSQLLKFCDLSWMTLQRTQVREKALNRRSKAIGSVSRVSLAKATHLFRGLMGFWHRMTDCRSRWIRSRTRFLLSHLP